MIARLTTDCGKVPKLFIGVNVVCSADWQKLPGPQSKISLSESPWACWIDGQ